MLHMLCFSVITTNLFEYSSSFFVCVRCFWFGFFFSMLIDIKPQREKIRFFCFFSIFVYIFGPQLFAFSFHLLFWPLPFSVSSHSRSLSPISPSAWHISIQTADLCGWKPAANKFSSITKFYNYLFNARASKFYTFLLDEDDLYCSKTTKTYALLHGSMRFPFAPKFPLKWIFHLAHMNRRTY